MNVLRSFHKSIAHGIPTITIGGGQRYVHTAAEVVDLPTFHRACRLAEALALS